MDVDAVEVITRPDAWRDRLAECRRQGRPVGLVPTMGALHAGHMSLIRRAAGDARNGSGRPGVVAVTDYVNPLQFGPNEDLAAYPRDLGRDRRLAGEAGADFLFAPTPEQLWAEEPDEQATTVRVSRLTDLLEGESRPGHFDGVTTIVAKLFSLSGPCQAYFGEKDYQQLTVVRRMSRDLSLPVEVIGCPTVRETDGLALSSRNAYLTAAERDVAPRLYSSLLAGKRALEEEGVVDAARVEQIMADHLGQVPSFALDYAAVADPEDLSRPGRIRGPVRLLMAARLGRARLIDNIDATPPPTERSRAVAATTVLHTTVTPRPDPRPPT